MICAGALALASFGMAHAGDVKIVAADFHRGVENRWSVNVTLEHEGPYGKAIVPSVPG